MGEVINRPDLTFMCMICGEVAEPPALIGINPNWEADVDDYHMFGVHLPCIIGVMHETPRKAFEEELAKT